METVTLLDARSGIWSVCVCVCVGAVERHDETKPWQKRDQWKLSPSNC